MGQYGETSRPRRKDSGGAGPGVLNDAPAEFSMPRRVLILLPLFIFGFIGLLPIMSIYEVVTTGTIDMEAVGRSRHEIPTWILYSVGWVCFLPFVVGFVPMLKYYRQPSLFRLSNSGLELNGSLFTRKEVKNISNSWRGLKIETSNKSYFVHANAAPGAAAALKRVFPDFQFNDRDASRWLTGAKS